MMPHTTETCPCDETHKAITRRTARTEKAAAAGGVLIEGAEWARVTFAEKPDRRILDALKAAGFAWGGGSWGGARAKLPADLTPADGG